MVIVWVTTGGGGGVEPPPPPHEIMPTNTKRKSRKFRRGFIATSF
jgi:hypothetical protein